MIIKRLNVIFPGTKATPLKDPLSFLWLGIAFLILLFANGMRIVPAAAWIGPLFMLRFLRTQKTLPGMVIGYVVNAIVFYFQWSSAFKDAGAMFSLYTAAFGLLVFLPYAADRLLKPRVNGFAATLILPAAWVTVEYLLHLFLPLGTFFDIAYTQSGNLPLLQIMSITGSWSITFLVIWVASIANYAWEGGFDIRKIGKGVLVYVLILSVVLLFGGLRLALFRPAGPTVQVSVLTTNIDKEPLPDAESQTYKSLIDGTLTAKDRQTMQQIIDSINNDLLERTKVQAESGSKIVTWSEYNAHIFSENEQQFLNSACQLAREEGIYLVFPLLVIEMDLSKRPEQKRFEVNKSVMITPEGKIAYEYVKHNLLIGPESENALRGPRQIMAIDTPYGTLSSVICLDMEYPDFMRLAGKQSVDIMLSGAIDGTPSSKGNPLHSNMAAFRAIEEGFSLGRAGFYGQIQATDYQGHILGSADHYTAGDRTVVAHLPIKGVRTLYSALGDFFPWLCIGILALLAAGSIFAGSISAGARHRILHKA